MWIWICAAGCHCVAIYSAPSRRYVQVVLFYIFLCCFKNVDHNVVVKDKNWCSGNMLYKNWRNNYANKMHAKHAASVVAQKLWGLDSFQWIIQSWCGWRNPFKARSSHSTKNTISITVFNILRLQSTMVSFQKLKPPTVRLQYVSVLHWLKLNSLVNGHHHFSIW